MIIGTFPYNDDSIRQAGTLTLTVPFSVEFHNLTRLPSNADNIYTLIHVDNIYTLPWNSAQKFSTLFHGRQLKRKDGRETNNVYYRFPWESI